MLPKNKRYINVAKTMLERAKIDGQDLSAVNLFGRLEVDTIPCCSLHKHEREELMKGLDQLVLDSRRQLEFEF